MGSKAVEDLIEASSGAHFSGFHLDNAEPGISQVEPTNTSPTENIKQPFVIGMCKHCDNKSPIFLLTMAKLSFYVTSY